MSVVNLALDPGDGLGDKMSWENKWFGIVINPDSRHGSGVLQGNSASVSLTSTQQIIPSQECYTSPPSVILRRKPSDTSVHTHTIAVQQQLQH